MIAKKVAPNTLGYTRIAFKAANILDRANPEKVVELREEAIAILLNCIKKTPLQQDFVERELEKLARSCESDAHF